MDWDWGVVGPWLLAGVIGLWTEPPGEWSDCIDGEGDTIGVVCLIPAPAPPTGLTRGMPTPGMGLCMAADPA